MPGAQAGRVAMRLWASFLNNSSSRWEPIWENWPLHMELIDIVSPIYRSDFQRLGVQQIQDCQSMGLLCGLSWLITAWLSLH